MNVEFLLLSIHHLLMAWPNEWYLGFEESLSLFPFQVIASRCILTKCFLLNYYNYIQVIACLDVRANDKGDLVVTKGDQYDVREHTKENEVWFFLSDVSVQTCGTQYQYNISIEFLSNDCTIEASREIIWPLLAAPFSYLNHLYFGTSVISLFFGRWETLASQLSLLASITKMGLMRYALDRIECLYFNPQHILNGVKLTG